MTRKGIVLALLGMATGGILATACKKSEAPADKSKAPTVLAAAEPSAPPSAEPPAGAPSRGEAMEAEGNFAGGVGSVGPMGHGYRSGDGVGFGRGGGRASGDEGRMGRRDSSDVDRMGGVAGPSAAPDPAATQPARPAESSSESAESGNQRPREHDTSTTVREPPRPTLAHTIYLSNDDTMSLSSAQRIEYAIDHGQPLPLDQIRPHELLNYYRFRFAPVAEGETFSVKAELAAGEEKGYTLLLGVQGKTVTRAARRPLALTLVVDVSGSMREEGKMEFLKRGLLAMLEELKPGDLVNLVRFNHEVQVALEGFQVSDDDLGDLRRAIEALTPGGSTDLDAGLRRGYDLAEKTADGERNSRVVLITDALTNTGETDEALIAEVGSRFDRKGIRLSGVGVGADFNDALLDRLTERGKGAYVFLGSEAAADRVFGERFIALMETIAEEVRFRLELPPSLAMERFYGEEASTRRERVQAIHYFAGTAQVFLSDLAVAEREPEPDDTVKLVVEYLDPETRQTAERTFSFRVGDVLGDPGTDLRKARLLMAYAEGLQAAAGYDRYRGDRQAMAKGIDVCDPAREDLAARARGLGEDPDVERVLGLFTTFCGRFEAGRPLRNNEFGQGCSHCGRDE